MYVADDAAHERLQLSQDALIGTHELYGGREHSGSGEVEMPMAHPRSWLSDAFWALCDRFACVWKKRCLLSVITKEGMMTVSFLLRRRGWIFSSGFFLSVNRITTFYHRIRLPNFPTSRKNSSILPAG